jgi:hypothetical protein
VSEPLLRAFVDCREKLRSQISQREGSEDGDVAATDFDDAMLDEQAREAVAAAYAARAGVRAAQESDAHTAGSWMPRTPRSCRELLCAEPEEALSLAERAAARCARDGTLSAALAQPFSPRMPEAAMLRAHWRSSFPGRRYALCTDFHGGPAACNREVLWEVGVVLHAEVDFANCRFSGTCPQRLKVLAHNDGHTFGMEPCPQQLRRSFFDAYRDDPEMARADIVFCSHPAANCEAYLPLNRSLVIYATTRLEFGRDDDSVWWRRPHLGKRSSWRWRHWVENMQAAARSPWVAVAANNLFDVHYVRYHTGITPQYIPSWCGGIGALYQRRAGLPWLLGPYRDNLPHASDGSAWEVPLLRSFRQAIARRGQRHRVRRMREVFPRGYEYKDLAAHPGVILVPYQVSFMSFFEFYRMEIPLFAPSLDLFVQWQREYGVCYERVYGHPQRLVDLLPDSTLLEERFDPTADDEPSLRYWLNKSDWYVFPHVTLFDSWDHLLELLDEANLDAISARMHEFNLAQHAELRNTWAALVNRIAPDPPGSRPVPNDLDGALRDLYALPPLPEDPRTHTSVLERIAFPAAEKCDPASKKLLLSPLF